MGRLVGESTMPALHRADLIPVFQVWETRDGKTYGNGRVENGPSPQKPLEAVPGGKI